MKKIIYIFALSFLSSTVFAQAIDITRGISDPSRDLDTPTANLTQTYDASVYIASPDQTSPDTRIDWEVSPNMVPGDPLDPGGIGGGSGGGDSGGGDSGGGGSGGGSTDEGITGDTSWIVENLLNRMVVETGPTEHTTALLGDQIDNNMGGLTFSATDIDLPGNFDLPVRLSRTFKGIRYGFYRTLDIGDWMLDIPYIHTTLVRNRTRFSGSWGQGKECSGNLNPGEISFYGSTYLNFEYWNGDTLHVPGRTTSKLLQNSGYITSASTYPKVTTSNWRIRCAANASTGGEKFIAQAPNGDQYTFAHLRLIGTKPLEKNFKAIPRSYAFMMVTQVKDVHGNTVDYEYNSAGQLSRIHASDGREINLSYNSAGALISASTGSRVWRYQYSGSLLNLVVRPDGKYWEYDLSAMGSSSASSITNCQSSWTTRQNTVSVKHPDGMLGEFTLKQRRFSRVNVASMFDAVNKVQLNPICHLAFAIDEKRLSGPRLSQDVVWRYQYSQTQGYFAGATKPTSARLSGGVPTGIDRYASRRTRVINPKGDVVDYYYNRNDQSAVQGKLLAKQHLSAVGGSVLETVRMTYSAGSRIGNTVMMIGNVKDDEYAIHQVKQVVDRIASSSDVYTTNYSSFTRYGAPQTIIESGNSGSRIINKTYQQNTSRWQLNLPTRKAIDSNSVVSWEYNSLGQVTKQTINGVSQSYTYSGSLLTSAYSPRGIRTQFSQYYRGIPRLVSRPSGDEHRAVNSYGEITGYTDKMGAHTDYSYDGMGRVIRVSPPIGPDTVISYGSHSYTVTQGANKKTYLLDAFNRVTSLTDTDTLQGNSRYQLTRYDVAGNVQFSSIVSASASESQGTTYYYDGLQRPVKQVSPYGTTRTEYLSNNRIRVTDANGYQTLSYRRGYGSPNDGVTYRIDSPSSSGTIVTQMSYDTAKRLTQVTQAGKTIRYDYHSQFGDYVVAEHYPAFTIHYARDAAGNMTSRWVGSNAATIYQYNDDNQVVSVNYPGAAPDITYQYRADGLMNSAKNGVGDWSYQYNALGQVTQAKLVANGASYPFTYIYNSRQHLATMTYPDGYSVNYAPDGRGQAQQAGSLVDVVARHNDGTIQRMDYANGTQSYRYKDSVGVRLSRLRVVKGGSSVVDKRYTFDALGNVTAITDGVKPNYSVSQLHYDGVGRLLEAQSPAFGSAAYSYDKRGNITQRIIGGAQQNYNYATNDLLMSVSGAVSRDFSYDTAGQVIDNGVIDFSYNGAEQLTRAGTAYYQYDAQGHRLITDTASGEALTIYSSGGRLLMTERNGVVADKIVLDGQVVAQVEDNQVRYFHHDALGSVIAESSNSGSMQYQHYRPFGEQIDAFASTNKQAYTGHIQDDTGLVYMQARYYDPMIGRFYSNDPIGFTGVSTFNRYSYVGNNPYKYTDPTGMTRKSSYDKCEDDPNCANLIPESSKHRSKKSSSSGGGELIYGPQVPIQQVKDEAANVKKAVSIVDKMLKDGTISQPVKDYILRSVQFEPRKVTNNGIPVYGLFVPTSNIINEGKIFIFLDGAGTLKDSIETYGHELGHFNLNWTHRRIESYGKSIYKKYEETKK